MNKLFVYVKYVFSKAIKKLHLKAIRKSKVHSTSKIEPGTEFVNSSMGKHSFCGYFCQIINAEIGSFTSIANNVVIGGGMHPIDWVSMSPVFYAGKDSVKAKFSEYEREKHKRTVIGSDVWIGQNAIIKQGISVGHGAVIGMGSVVTKDVPPYAVVGGVPAKFIKSRFSEQTIRKMLESKWWEMSDIDLRIHARFIKSPEKFLESMGL